MKLEFLLVMLCVSSQFAFAEDSKMASSPEAMEESVTIEGVRYENVRWGKLTLTTVTVYHKTGVAVIPLNKLPPDLQKRFRYDPQKVEEYNQKAREYNEKVQEYNEKQKLKLVKSKVPPKILIGISRNIKGKTGSHSYYYEISYGLTREEVADELMSANLFLFHYHEVDGSRLRGPYGLAEEVRDLRMFIPRDELENLRMLLQKFIEWSGIAQKHGFEDIKKDISYGSLRATFLTPARLEMSSETLYPQDAPAFLSLIGRIPEIDAEAGPKIEEYETEKRRVDDLLKK